MSKGEKSAKGGRSRWRGVLWRLALVGIVAAGVVLVYLDAKVTTEFEGRKWAIPAKVFARPLELYEGKPLRRQDFEWELRALGYRFEPGGPGFVSVQGDRFRVHTRGFGFVDGAEPARRLEVNLSGGRVASLRALEGDTPSLVRLEPMMIGALHPGQHEDRLLVPLSEVPPAVVASLLAVEDRDFYDHFGLSFSGIGRALFANLRAGGVVQGGSTVTQQLVKNFYLNERRTLSRKALEAAMAVLLEIHYSKEQILETYLNEVYLGQQGSRAVHGFALGSRHYFNQPLAELELHQIALLIGLVKGPSLYDPWRSPERALARRNVVLGLLEEQGIASAADIATARARPLDVAERNFTGTSNFPAYLDLVRKQLARDYPAEVLDSEGLRIYTGFDPIAQRAAERAVTEGVARLEQARKLPEGVLQSAAVMVSVETGEVAAMVGGRQVRYAGFNRAVDARRPIGSLAKPAVYLTALQSGRYTLASPVSDAPVSHKGANGQWWRPRNYDKKSHGTPLLVTALAQSYNQSTARLGLDLGVPAVLDTFRELGVARELLAVPSVMLGAIDLSPLEVAGMYQTLAAGGYRSPLRAIREVVDADGKPLSRYPFKVEKAASPQAVYLLNQALLDVTASGTGAPVYRSLSRGFPVAGKTGTSDDQRDSWFAGFSSDLLAVVWLGRDDNQPTRFTGGTGAAPIWAAMMAEAAREPYRPTPPAGVEYHWVDGSGRLAAQGCPGARQLPFLVGTAPSVQGGCTGNPLRNMMNEVNEWFGF